MCHDWERIHACLFTFHLGCYYKKFIWNITINAFHVFLQVNTTEVYETINYNEIHYLYTILSLS